MKSATCIVLGIGLAVGLCEAEPAYRRFKLGVGDCALVVNTSEEEQSVPAEPGVLLFGRQPKDLPDGKMSVAPYDVLLYRNRKEPGEK